MQVDKEVKQDKVDVVGHLIDTIMMTAFTMDPSKAFKRVIETSQLLVQFYCSFMMLLRWDFINTGYMRTEWKIQIANSF